MKVKEAASSEHLSACRKSFLFFLRTGATKAQIGVLASQVIDEVLDPFTDQVCGDILGQVESFFRSSSEEIRSHLESLGKQIADIVSSSKDKDTLVAEASASQADLKRQRREAGIVVEEIIGLIGAS